MTFRLTHLRYGEYQALPQVPEGPVCCLCQEAIQDGSCPEATCSACWREFRTRLLSREDLLATEWERLVSALGPDPGARQRGEFRFYALAQENPDLPPAEIGELWREESSDSDLLSALNQLEQRERVKAVSGEADLEFSLPWVWKYRLFLKQHRELLPLRQYQRLFSSYDEFLALASQYPQLSTPELLELAEERYQHPIQESPEQKERRLFALLMKKHPTIDKSRLRRPRAKAYLATILDRDDDTIVRLFDQAALYHRF